MESDDLPFRRDIRPVLEVGRHGHAMVAFVNDVFVGNLDPPPSIFVTLISFFLVCSSFH